MSNRKTLIRQFLFVITLLLVSVNSFAQVITCEAMEKDLIQVRNKVSRHYPFNRDSLEYYSKQFNDKIVAYICKYPTTLNYSFQKLIENRGCEVATSTDSCFRIYSWKTLFEDTMTGYKNIYQYRSGGKTFTKVSHYGGGDIGGNWCFNIYSLKANDRTYYLAQSNLSESCISGQKK